MVNDSSDVISLKIQKTPETKVGDKRKVKIGNTDVANKLAKLSKTNQWAQQRNNQKRIQQTESKYGKPVRRNQTLDYRKNSSANNDRKCGQRKSHRLNA